MNNTTCKHAGAWAALARLGLIFGATLAFMLVVVPTAQAAPAPPLIDVTPWATSAIDFLKDLWVFVILAEIVAALTYAAAFFTQSWMPSFYQAFQGDWIKKAVILGFAAHPVMGVLYAAAEAAKSGYN